MNGNYVRNSIMLSKIFSDYLVISVCKKKDVQTRRNLDSKHPPWHLLWFKDLFFCCGGLHLSGCNWRQCGDFLISTKNTQKLWLINQPNGLLSNLHMTKNQPQLILVKTPSWLYTSRETPQFRIAPPDADLDDLLAEDSVSQQSNGTTDSNIFHPSVVHISKHKQNILIVATK